MQFFHITRADGIKSHTEQSQYFASACAALGIDYRRIIDSDLTLAEFNALTLRPGDAIYRSSTSKKAIALERQLIADTTKTIFFNNHTVLTGKGGSYNLMKKIGLPVIKSVPFLPKKKLDAIDFAEYLGGFPLVIKVMGGMEGIGVMRVDSLQSLNSVSDFIKKDSGTEVCVMEFIPHEYYARLVVVGDTVVAATRDVPPVGDFRANALGPRAVKGEVFTPTDDMAAAAVAATHALGVKTAGVDLLINDTAFYIAEANMPYNFAETQRRTGVDIALAIVTEITQ